jgi:hypothetical protein
MLEKVKYYVEYGQAVINYTQKVFAVVNTAVRGWPVWIPPGKAQIKTPVD